MRNHEVTSKRNLLDSQGSLAEPGWSRKLLQIYDRNSVKAPKFRIKEWDYYLIVSEKNDFAVALTISDDGYIGLQSATLIDFSIPWEHTETILTPAPLGRLRLPSTSENGNTCYHDKRLDCEFRISEGERRLICNFKRFKDKKTFSCDIVLQQEKSDSMVIATPWKEDKQAFYYNQKINCMRASGFARFDGKDYVFDPDTDFGTLDWGRGVWTYDNTWKWSSGNALVDGHKFGFNLGYGFGDTSAASENIIFYDNAAHKIDDVEFKIPDIYENPWTISSSDGRFEADFIPIIDRAAKIDAKFIVSDQHQVFGRMSGKAVLDDGFVVSFKDVLCFAEDVHNKY